MNDDVTGPCAQTVAMLSASSAPALPADFNARLAQRWDQRRRARRLHIWSAVSGLAATLCIVSAIVWSVLASPSITWADVAGSLKRIDQFSLVLSQADDEGSKAVEIYYAATDTWRLHVKDNDPSILILNPVKGDGLYRIHDRKWERRGDKIDLPDFTGLTARLDQANLLDVVLQHYFENQRVEPKPVESAVSGVDKDLQVFDYAADPSKAHARIWVLKSSRLPVRMRLVKPAEHQTTWIDFDYSDPQPAAFFNVNEVDRQLGQGKLQHVQQFFEAGKAGR